MSYLDLVTIATTSDFQTRVRFALFVGAVAVYTESGATPSHAQRALYATGVVNGRFDLTGACFAVLTNPTIQAEAVTGASPNGIPDADIQFTVNSLWNTLAGA